MLHRAANRATIESYLNHERTAHEHELLSQRQDCLGHRRRPRHRPRHRDTAGGRGRIGDAERSRRVGALRDRAGTLLLRQPGRRRRRRSHRTVVPRRTRERCARSLRRSRHHRQQCRLQLGQRHPEDHGRAVPGDARHPSRRAIPDHACGRHAHQGSGEERDRGRAKGDEEGRQHHLDRGHRRQPRAGGIRCRARPA